jgi:uncharacterized secreted repeat protein (TIGR03808 family)
MTHFYVPRDRRHFLASVAALVPFYNALARAQSDPVAAATSMMIAGLNEAALARRPFRLPPGVTTIYHIPLPEGTHLVAARGGSTLRLGYNGGLLSNSGPLDRLTFEGVTFDGANRPTGDGFGLLTFTDVAHVEMDNCTIQHSTTGLLQRRCGGSIRLSTFQDLSNTAIHDDNCAGVTIDANTIRRCGDNGVHHWSLHTKRHDGSRISNNVITDIANRSGGDGMFGNGVRVAECGPVLIENNVVERCAYTAIRNAGGWDVVVANNRCKSFNEKAMYAEFGFRNATFVNNVIEDCGGGISATNYIGPGNGAGAQITGNVLSNIRPSHPNTEFGPRSSWLTGIEGEGDVLIKGNIVSGSAWFGIIAGFFNARHNVTVEDNRLIDNDYAIGFATQDGVGPCSIIGNDMRGSKKANIVAMFQEKIISGDLSAPQAANAYKNIVIRDNRVD